MTPKEQIKVIHERIKEYKDQIEKLESHVDRLREEERLIYEGCEHDFILLVPDPQLIKYEAFECTICGKKKLVDRKELTISREVKDSVFYPKTIRPEDRELYLKTVYPEDSKYFTPKLTEAKEFIEQKNKHRESIKASDKYFSPSLVKPNDWSKENKQ